MGNQNMDQHRRRLVWRDEYAAREEAEDYRRNHRSTYTPKVYNCTLCSDTKRISTCGMCPKPCPACCRSAPAGVPAPPRRPSQPRRGNTNAMRSRFEQQGHRVRRLISTDPTPEIVPALEAKPASGFLASAMDSQAVQVLFLPMLFIVYWVGKVISSPVSKDDKSGYVSVATASPEPERAIEIVKGD